MKKFIEKCSLTEESVKLKTVKFLNEKKWEPEIVSVRLLKLNKNNKKNSPKKKKNNQKKNKT